MSKVDPITFAVVRNKLISIANAMQEIALHCGVTTFMYEVRDCSFGLLDTEWGVISQSNGIPLFVGTLGPATKGCVDVMGAENLEPGDIIISNVPEITGNHTSDAILFSPLFYHGKVFGYAATKAHWIDLGAKSSYPADAESYYEEGLHIPPVKLYKKGKLQSELGEIIKFNSRAPDLVWGDIQAQIAGCHLAEQQVSELLDKYGVGTVQTTIRETYDYSEHITRQAIDKMPEGSWEAEDYLDSNGIDLDKPIPIKVKVTIQGSDIIIDLSGSAPEQKGPMNGLWITTLSAARAAVKALTSPDLPANEGSNRPIALIAPKGSVFNANPALPSFLCADVAASLLELINKALYRILPERVPACSGGSVIGVGFFGSDSKTGRYWGTITNPDIGQGADFNSDGENYLMHHAASGCKNIPAEILEPEFPLFIEKCEFIQNSGGAGRHRGGLATRFQIKLLAPGTFYSFMEKAKSPHWGVHGGKEGLRNFILVQSKNKGEFEVLKTSGVALEAEDRVIIHAGGGGGYGDPLERSPEAVRCDAINGYVSVEHAKNEYGVVIDPLTLAIDVAATQKLRVQES